MLAFIGGLIIGCILGGHIAVEKYKEQERLVKIITQMSRSDKQ